MNAEPGHEPECLGRAGVEPMCVVHADLTQPQRTLECVPLCFGQGREGAQYRPYKLHEPGERKRRLGLDADRPQDAKVVCPPAA